MGFTGLIWACVRHHHKGFTYHTIHSFNFGRMMKSNFLFQMFRHWDPKEIAPLLAPIKVGRSVISTISAVRFSDVLFTPKWTIPPPPLCLLLDPGILVRTQRTAGCKTFSKCTTFLQSLLIPDRWFYFRHFGSGSLNCDWDPRKWDLDQLHIARRVSLDG